MYGNETLVKNYIAGAAVEPYRIVKFSADLTVIHGAASTDALIGVSVATISVPSGQRVDVVKDGIAQVKLGGVVTRGDPITSDATGQGVAAAPGAGVNARIIGFAEVSGANGDIIPVHVVPGRIQG